MELGVVAQEEEEKRNERQRVADEETAKKRAKAAREVDFGDSEKEDVARGYDVTPSLSESEPLLGTPDAGEVGD